MRLASEALLRYRLRGGASRGESRPIDEKAPGSACDERQRLMAMSSRVGAQRATRGLSGRSDGIGPCRATPQGTRAPSVRVAAVLSLREAFFFKNELPPTCRNGVTRAWSRCKLPKNLDLGRIERYTCRETRGAERNA